MQYNNHSQCSLVRKRALKLGDVAQQLMPVVVRLEQAIQAWANDCPQRLELSHVAVLGAQLVHEGSAHSSTFVVLPHLEGKVHVDDLIGILLVELVVDLGSKHTPKREHEERSEASGLCDVGVLTCKVAGKPVQNTLDHRGIDDGAGDVHVAVRRDECARKAAPALVARRVISR